ncbi:hypothetical protein [Streptomyces sp. NPDC047028]|uniref:hypothetical protein n=1 Tax=Streptomyces sp. NPDC047028 TaxID=3155793 RepID=UPI0033C16844
MDAGLAFVAWQVDPGAFVEVWNRLAGSGRPARLTRHESTAVFAVPEGAASDAYVGRRLLEG